MNHDRIFTRTSMQPIRRDLRNNATSAEAALWKHLKGSQLEDRKFRRQHSVGNYVVDFYCPAEKLAVELDGAGHFTAVGLESDELREAYIAEQGVRVLRFENRLVFEEIEWVLGKIREEFGVH